MTGVLSVILLVNLGDWLSCASEARQMNQARGTVVYNDRCKTKIEQWLNETLVPCNTRGKFFYMDELNV